MRTSLVWKQKQQHRQIRFKINNYQLIFHNSVKFSLEITTTINNFASSIRSYALGLYNSNSHLYNKMLTLIIWNFKSNSSSINANNICSNNLKCFTNNSNHQHHCHHLHLHSYVKPCKVHLLINVREIRKLWKNTSSLIANNPLWITWSPSQKYTIAIEFRVHRNTKLKRL